MRPAKQRHARLLHCKTVVNTAVLLHGLDPSTVFASTSVRALWELFYNPLSLLTTTTLYAHDPRSHLSTLCFASG
jgi:hypothetical protein